MVLDPSGVSIHLIEVSGKGMIGKLEVEVTAHAFDERIQKQMKYAYIYPKGFNGSYSRYGR